MIESKHKLNKDIPIINHPNAVQTVHQDVHKPVNNTMNKDIPIDDHPNAVQMVHQAVHKPVNNTM
ncbi:hypothetical protein HCN44_009031, partial [Aphidius gifuensis]